MNKSFFRFHNPIFKNESLCFCFMANKSHCLLLAYCLHKWPVRKYIIMPI